MKNAKTLTCTQKAARFLLLLLVIPILFSSLVFSVSAEEDAPEWKVISDDDPYTEIKDPTLSHHGKEYQYHFALSEFTGWKIGLLRWAPDSDCRYNTEAGILATDGESIINAVIRTDEPGSGILCVESEDTDALKSGIYLTSEAYREFYYYFRDQGVAVSEVRNGKEYRSYLPEEIMSVEDLTMYATRVVITRAMLDTLERVFVLSKFDATRSLFEGDGFFCQLQGSYVVIPLGSLSKEDAIYRPTGEPGYYAYRLEDSDANMILSAIDALVPVKGETSPLVEEPYQDHGDARRIGSLFFLGLFGLLLIAPAIALLIFGLIFPHLKKYRYAKRWYLLAAFAALWIVLLLILLILLVILS